MRKTVINFIRKHFYGYGLSKVFGLGLQKWYHRQLYKSVGGKVQVHGLTLHLDEKDSMQLATGRTKEPETIDRLKQDLKEGMVFIDAGAHVGYYTLLASKLVGKKGKVIAYEPSEHNYEVLKKNVETNNLENVDFYQYAVSEKDGTATFWLSEISTEDNSLFKDTNSAEGLTVKSVKLDTHVKHKVDFMKVDVEGAEHLVLQGAEKIILKDKPVLIVEYRITEERKPQFLELLLNHGYYFEMLDASFSREGYSCNIYATPRKDLNA